MRRFAALAPANAALCGCADPNGFTLRSAEASIHVTVEPLAFVVRGGDGRAVLTASETTVIASCASISRLSPDRSAPSVRPFNHRPRSPQCPG